MERSGSTGAFAFLIKSPNLGKVVPRDDTAYHKGKKDAQTSPGENIVKSVVYGLIVATLIVPSMFGYATIIFADPFFVIYRPVLSKLVILSSAIHQLCFQFLSPLPYSIGQVQDAGLIFLFAM
jgi:SulP family sulfate permease